MNTVDSVKKAAQIFYKEEKADSNGRFRSWEHCYNTFRRARNSNKRYDELSLQLAFYLASWGMYRGSSFLLQKDYKVHIPIVKKILKKKYNPLQGIECKKLLKKSNQNLLIELTAEIEKYYSKIREDVFGNKIKSKVSQTLITKLLMGTLGCVPAYDRYFVAGIRKEKIATGTYSIKSIIELATFYKNNEDTMEDLRRKMKVYGNTYPQMKVIDMAFWEIGSGLYE